MKAANLSSIALAIILFWSASEPARGNLFVALPAGPFSPGVIGEYTNSGETVNASLISGLIGPGRIAVSKGFIYVIDKATGTIGKYTTSGATIDPALITGLNDPQDVEVSGGDLYVSDFGNGLNGRVGKYTTSGEAVNTSLITGLPYGTGFAVMGTKLFVGTSFDTLGEYTTSGETVNAFLITGLQGPGEVEVSGSSLFIAHGLVDDIVIGKYKLDGTAVDPSLIFDPFGEGEFAVSGAALYLAQLNTLAKYTTSGELVTYPLIPPFGPSGFQISGVAVDDSATVPETLSTLWFGLTTAALLGFARKRQRRPRPSVPVVVVGTILISCAVPKVSFGNLFISETDGNDFTTISVYTNSGAPVNPALIQLKFGGPIAVSDGFIYVTYYHDGTIGKYTTSGATVNASLISGLNDPWDIEISDGFLYVAESGADRVGKYTTSGATVNASLISGLPSPYGLAVSGTNLFVNGAVGPVGKYTTSGATVNASLPTGIQYGFESIYDLEVSGSTLFITHSIDDYWLGKFNLDGTAIDARLITPPTGAVYFAVSGTDVFITGVSGPGQGTVSNYTTSGDLVADPLISGLGFSFGIAVDNSATVPETLSTLWFGLTAFGLLGFARFLRVRRPL